MARPGCEFTERYQRLLGDDGLGPKPALAVPRARILGFDVPLDRVGPPIAFVLRHGASLVGDAFRVGRRLLRRPDVTIPSDVNDALARSGWGFYTRYLEGECGRFQHDVVFEPDASIDPETLARAVEAEYSAGLVWGKAGRARFPLDARGELDVSADQHRVVVRLEKGGPIVQRISFQALEGTSVASLHFDVAHAGCDGANLFPMATRIAERLGLRPARVVPSELGALLKAIDTPLVQSVALEEAPLFALRRLLSDELGLPMRDAVFLHLVCYDRNARASGAGRHDQNDLRFCADPQERLRLRRGGRFGLADLCHRVDTGDTRGAREALSALIDAFASGQNQLELISRGLHVPPRLQPAMETIGWTALFWGNAELSGAYMSSELPHRLPDHWFPDFAARAMSGFVDFGPHHIAGPALSQRTQVAASTCSRIETADGSHHWIVRTKVNPSGGPYVGTEPRD